MPPDNDSDFKNSLLEAIHLHNNMQLDEAISCYRSLLEVRPDNPDLWNLLGAAAHQKNQNSLAERLINTALSLKNDAPDFHNNLGMVYRGLDRDDDAKLAFRHAIELNPSHAKALSNLAGLFRQQGKFGAALVYARRAVCGNPQDPDALNNLGNAEKDNGLVEDAIGTYRRAIAVRPDFALGHWNLALALLSLGQMKQGFEEMAWRWKWDNFPGFRRNFPQPIWNGEDLSGKTILLHPEQGLGDTIQFMRYASLVKDLATHLYVELPPSLVPLAHDTSLADNILVQGDKLPNFDLHAPFMDLPRILKTTSKTIPANVPYLAVDQKLREAVRLWIDQFDGIKIGLNWSGNSASPLEQFRRISPEALTILSDLSGISWFSLQNNEESLRLPKLNKRFVAPLQEVAALIMELDLIITSDTAVAHLAGALGKPVWILLHHAPDWRWLTTGETSPWYPTARLFRQSRAGNWLQVVKNVVFMLKDIRI